MSESNNVKFVEDESKWVWKCYDANGSVTHRSQLFNSEKEAREDYEINGGQYKASASQSETPAQDQQVNVAIDPVPQNEMTAGNVAPEGEINADTTAPADSEAGLVS